MKKKPSKEKLLRAKLEEVSGELRAVRADKARKDAIVEQIQSALKIDSYRVDVVAEVWKLVAIRDFYQGRRMPEVDHVLSLEKILRWTINPETAKNDEEIARFNEERKRMGF